MNGNSNESNMPLGNSTSDVSREEYMSKLQKWIEDAGKHNEMALGLWSASTSQIFSNAHTTTTTTTTDNPLTFNRPGFYIYIIPPMWKRVVAEIIDFLILFVIKMFLTIIVLESFDILDLDNYGLSTLQKKLQNPKIALQMSVELLLLEILHRFIVCLYETYWLMVRCATPGKRYMGLAVVHAVSVSHVQGDSEETVLAFPCMPLGIKDALLRAILKNVLVGLLLPICFLLLFFKYNRTGYDLMTNSLVVEYNPNPPMQEHR